MPATSKMAAFDPFAAYPPMDASALTTDIPPEYLRQLRSLLPSLPNVARVANLASCRRDQSGQVVQETPVVNRPWEWIEHLGEPSNLDAKEAEREREEKQRLKVKYLVKNTGSLSLDTFGARMTGDGILETRTDDPVIEGNLRTFEDGLSSDSIFKRDWRETRLEVGTAPTTHQGRAAPASAHEPSSSSSATRLTSRASPASSPHSRSSARVSVRRGSPSVNRSSNSSEIIDVDMLPNTSTSSRRTGSSSKRKGPPSDDEVVIIEGPMSAPKPKKQRTASKTVATKAKPRKR